MSFNNALNINESIPYGNYTRELAAEKILGDQHEFTLGKPQLFNKQDITP